MTGKNLYCFFLFYQKSKKNIILFISKESNYPVLYPCVLVVGDECILTPIWDQMQGKKSCLLSKIIKYYIKEQKSNKRNCISKHNTDFQAYLGKLQ